MRRSAIRGREEMLFAAMSVFWQKGYSGASVEDLQEAMHLNRGSIYFHFSSKRNLYLEVLKYYRSSVVARRRNLVLNAKSGRDGIEVFFEDILGYPLRGSTPLGCLNTNSATEVGPLDPEIARYLRQGMARWEKFWVQIAERGQKDGSLSKKRSPKPLLSRSLY